MIVRITYSFRGDLIPIERGVRNVDYDLRPVVASAAVMFSLEFIQLLPAPPFSLTLNPLSLVIVFPALAAASLSADRFTMVGATLGALIVPTIFIVVARLIAKRGVLIPRLTSGAFLVIVILSFAGAIFGWRDTIRFTSLTRGVSLVIQCGVPPLVLVGAFLGMRNHLTKGRSIALHWFGFMWIAWSAFPWWGELL